MTHDVLVCEPPDLAALEERGMCDPNEVETIDLGHEGQDESDADLDSHLPNPDNNGHDSSANSDSDGSYYSCDSDSEDDLDVTIDDDEIFDECEELRRWAVECGLELKHLSSLLLIFRQRLLPQLPKTGQTFLKTNKPRYSIDV